MTSDDPKVVVPSVTNYPLCGTYPGTAGAGEKVQITCLPGTVGRYLIVQLKGKNALTLCEVQVFGG